MKNLELQAAILRTGRTQKQFAREIGMPASTLSNVVHCRWVLRPHEMQRIAEALKRPVRVLFPES